MKRRHILFVLTLSVLAVVAIVAAGELYVPYQEKLPEGVVDWDEGWIRTDVTVPLNKNVSIGRAVADARRVAEMKAQASALRIAMQIPIDSEKRLQEYEALKIRVKGVVAGGEVVSEKREGNNYLLSYKVPINGVKGIASEVSKVILPPPPPPPPPKPKITRKTPEPEMGAKKAPEEKKEEGVKSLAAFTSVTVDGTSAGVKPALRTKIVDPDGKEVYGPSTVKPEVVKEKSLAAFVTPKPGSSSVSNPLGICQSMGSFPLALIKPLDILLAQSRGREGRHRGGDNSYTVKAEAASGKLKSDIVVTRETAQKLRELDKETGTLSHGKVIVVVRADVGGVESRRRDTIQQKFQLVSR